MNPDPHPPFTIKRYISAGELLRQLTEQLETNRQRIRESDADRRERMAQEAEEKEMEKSHGSS